MPKRKPTASERALRPRKYGTQRPVMPAGDLGYRWRKEIKDLWQGVVYQAEDDAGYDPTPRELREHVLLTRDEAFEWVFDDTRAGAGSFLWACALAGLNPATVRDRIRRKRAAAGEHVGAFDDE